MINVYVMDVITGHMIFHGNHRKAQGPLQIVHSENWVVVSTIIYQKIMLPKMLIRKACSLCVSLVSLYLMSLILDNALICYEKYKLNPLYL